MVMHDQNEETVSKDEDVGSIHKSSTEVNHLKKNEPDENQSLGIIEVAKKKNVVEKLIFITSVSTLFFLAHAVITIHWVLPYYYAASAPILILVRVIIYWNLKWQLFMLDFCYLGNILCYVYMWAAPANENYFIIVFAISNGPLVFGALMFRNALVFHSLDRMTSVYIHLLPAYLTYGIRWFPAACSSYWYQPFVSVHNEPSFIWLLAVPMGAVLGHSAAYVIVVVLIIKPKEEFLDSYRYLTGKENSLVFRIINICGSKGRRFVYYSLNYLFAAVTLALTRLWYEYLIAHSIFLALVTVLVSWNGASFYMDVFRKKGTQAD